LTGVEQRREAVIDVLVAAWNRSDTIERAISSALAEPEVRKVIVVDDGSTDDTMARAERIFGGSERILIRRLSSNRGPAAARNHALQNSTAPWFTALDGDDFLLPGRMSKLLSHAADWDFVGDDILKITKTGAASPHPVMFNDEFKPWRLDFAAFVLSNSGRRGRSRAEFGYFKPLMRRSFLDRHGLRYDERLRLGEDYALYAHALALGARFLVTPPFGYVSLLRSDSLSARHTRQDLERLRDVDTQLARIPSLSDRDRRALRSHYRSVDGRVQWLTVIDAFKSRNPTGFLSPFARSPEVAFFLARKLLEEAYQRSGKWLSQQRRS
jgi:succinoglycan biosynthesis protein ExoU